MTYEGQCEDSYNYPRSPNTMKQERKESMTAEEKHLRSALENGGYTEERINEIALAMTSHASNKRLIEELVKACHRAFDLIDKKNNHGMGSMVDIETGFVYTKLFDAITHAKEAGF